MTTAEINRPATNRTPQHDDRIRTWNYKTHEHNEELIEYVSSNEGPAVGGGYYVYMKSGPVIAVEARPEKIGEEWVWWEKHPRVEQRHDA